MTNTAMKGVLSHFEFFVQMIKVVYTGHVS
uniref:Uncharacterized protein n=1 Tax=Anguilla anguilla TaxID=7936 RepID=A0A0E9U553_ANGAN